MRDQTLTHVSHKAPNPFLPRIPQHHPSVLPHTTPSIHTPALYTVASQVRAAPCHCTTHPLPHPSRPDPHPSRSDPPRPASCPSPPSPFQAPTPAPQRASQWRPPSRRARTHTPPREAVCRSESCAPLSCGARARGGRVAAARAASVAGARARPAAIGRPPRRPAQPSSSGAAPRPQRALCFLKFIGPWCPFCVQPHLHAAVTLQQSVAHSATGGR